MANHYYGAAIGGQMPLDVTEASSTTGKDVELVVNLSTATDKVAVLKALEGIEYRIVADAWPPA